MPSHLIPSHGFLERTGSVPSSSAKEKNCCRTSQTSQMASKESTRSKQAQGTSGKELLWSCRSEYAHSRRFLVKSQQCLHRPIDRYCMKVGKEVGTVVITLTKVLFAFGNCIFQSGMSPSSPWCVVSQMQDLLGVVVADFVSNNFFGGQANICTLAAQPLQPACLSTRSTSPAYFGCVNTNSGRPVWVVSSCWLLRQRLYRWLSHDRLKKETASAMSALDLLEPAHIARNLW